MRIRTGRLEKEISDLATPTCGYLSAKSKVPLGYIPDKVGFHRAGKGELHRAERLEAELDKLKQQEPAYLLTPAGYVVGAQLDAGHAPGTLIKLYLAAGAQPAKLLTDEQLKKMHHEDQFGLFCDYDEFEQIARAIEAAHGIKEILK